MHAIVLAAGEGRRLRPLTEHWPKPVLPIDGRPVLATLLRELAAARVEHVWLVTGHLREQVETLAGDGAAFGVPVTIVHQPSVRGSADAVERAVRAGAPLPALVLAADTVFRPGDVATFAGAFAADEAAGAIAVRRDPPPGTGRPAVATSGGRVVRVHDADPANPLSGAPLWALGGAVAERLCLDREPYELANAFQRAIDDGADVVAVEIGRTRDLTDSLDLVEENFPYLSR
jgi:NDP-sugar pyrophosphorylase family protein